LLTHRAIKAILLGKKYEPKWPHQRAEHQRLERHPQAAGQGQGRRQGKESRRPDRVGCAGRALLGQRAPRRRSVARCRSWLKCYFMQDKLGEEYTGIITGVTTFGIFVQLDQLFVEGLVHVTDLGADYFQYDDARHELRGERTGKTFQLTDRARAGGARGSGSAQDRSASGRHRCARKSGGTVQG
jgi:ribonuclease R